VECFGWDGVGVPDKEKDDARRAFQSLPEVGAEEVARVEDLAAQLALAGDVLHTVGYVTRLEAASDARVAVQMTGELARGVVTPLSTGNWYAGLALVRQLLEVQYLLAAFAREPSSIGGWRRSTKADRTGGGRFAPATLRQAGMFRDDDYWNHCERGGHPTPLGVFLVRFEGSDESDDAIGRGLGWRDAANHLLQVTNEVVDVSAALDLGELIGPDLDSAVWSVAEWLARDADTLSRVTRPPPSDP